MATTYEFEEAWRSVGAQIKAAMDTTWGWRETFLADHDRQAADVGVRLLRSIPEADDLDLVRVLGELGEKLIEHTRFLCGVAHLNASQAECLMAASRRGFVRFLGAYRDATVMNQVQTREQVVARIEAALTVSSRVNLFPNAQASPGLIG